MKGLIVFYTNCLLPRPLLRKTLESAASAAERNDFMLVVSSHLPVTPRAIGSAEDFERLKNGSPDDTLQYFLDSFDVSVDLPEKSMNVETGVLKYQPETILSQIIHAMKVSGVDTGLPVVLWEHDVLYPDDYVEKVCAPIIAGKEYSLYHDHVFADPDGFYKPQMHFWHLSRYAARISSLMNHFSSKVNLDEPGVLEPVPAEFANGDERPEDIVHNYAIVRGTPVLDIKHGANASGQILMGGRRMDDPSWGDFSDIKPLFEDPDYEMYLLSHPDIGYGLFTCKMGENW